MLQGGTLTPTLLSVILFVYMIFVQFAWGDWADNGQRPSLLRLPKLLLSFVLNTVLAGLAQFIGLFKYRKQNDWDKTEHTMAVPESETCQIQVLDHMKLMEEDRAKASTIA